jgi:hypothetical protein
LSANLRVWQPEASSYPDARRWPGQRVTEDSISGYYGEAVLGKGQRRMSRIPARIVGPGWHGDRVTRSEQLDQADEALKAAVAAQVQDADPAHEDFYAWGWALSGP